MKYIVLLLAAAWLTTVEVPGHSHVRPLRQPFPERGFWVVQTNPEKTGTIVRYYANSLSLVREVCYGQTLDISRLSVRRFLNRQLKAELASNSALRKEPPLYKMD